MSQIVESTIKAAHPVLRETYCCLIDGALSGSESGKTFPTFNPAMGEKLADVPDCDASDIVRAVRGAQKAFGLWRRVTPAERGNYCRRFAERLRPRM
jgi:acyl-CoA reductase-like NAD-dependent aldehyde dehydrogenase